MLTDYWVNALYALLPWTLMCLVIIVAPGSGTGTAVVGVALFAIPLTLINMNLPQFQPRWINHWLIPWGEAVVVVVFAFWWQKRKKKAAAG